MVSLINPTTASVKIQEDDFWFIAPKGSLIAISDTSNRIELKTLASRKSIFGFNWENCNKKAATKEETLEAINAIL